MTDHQSGRELTESGFVERLDELIETAEENGIAIERSWTCRSTVEGMVWDVKFVQACERADGESEDDD